MSGFEVVGVVLGAVPLLISGLEHYRDGVETIQDMVQYAETVSVIATSVSTSLAIYRQSCETLLQGLMLPPNVLDDLLHDPASSTWKDKDLGVQLEARFGSAQEYATYLRAVHKLNARVHKMRTKMGLNEHFQPLWMNGTQVDAGTLADFFSRGRNILRAVKMGFQNKKYLELAAGIERDVLQVKTLTKGARTLEPIRAERRVKDAAKSWLNARECARRLFQALNAQWSRPCHCGGKPHVASIRLDMAEKSCLEPPRDSRLMFRMLFTFGDDGQKLCNAPWKWRVIEIEAKPAPDPADFSSSILTTGHRQVHFQVTSTPGIVVTAAHSSGNTDTLPGSSPIPRAAAASTSARQAAIGLRELHSSITNLCRTLELASQPQVHCLGFLQDDVWQHNVYIADPWQNMDRWSSGFASLEQLLKSPERIGTKPKYRIAATLASAVFQFHATPWLNDQWGLREIQFIKDTGNRIMVDHSYISRSFLGQQPANSGKTRWQQRPAVYNETIFALGVALLELSFGESLTNLAQPEDLDENGAANVLTEISIAKRLASTLDEREPSKYVDVVDRCLRCRFDTTSTSLEDSVFLALFCQGVVIPLQQICDSLS